MYNNQDLTLHLEQHTTRKLDPNCEFCEIYEQNRDEDHRQRQIFQNAQELREIAYKMFDKGFMTLDQYAEVCAANKLLLF